MSHAEIEERHVVARYEMERLPDDERLAFEEHLVDCAECQDALETEHAFRHGLRGAMPAARRNWRWLGVAALVAIAFGVGYLARRENRADRAGVTPAPQVAAAPAVTAAPALLFTLNRVRSGEGEPVNQLMLTNEPRVIVLMVDAEDSGAARVTIARSDGQRLWTAEHIVPSSAGTLAVAVPSQLLTGDDYVVTIEGKTAERYTFRVRR